MALHLEVLRRLRLRLEAENPAPAGEIWTVKRLMFLSEMTAAYERERPDFTQEHGDALAEKYGIRSDSPEPPQPTAAELAVLLARPDLHCGERLVLEMAADGSSRPVIRDYREGAITAADVLERIDEGLRPEPVLDVNPDGLLDGGHHIH
jgi:hypothetical protein